MTSPPDRGARRAPSFERRTLLLALLVGFPAAVVALPLLWSGDYSPRVQWTLSVLVLGIWWISAFALREHVVRPLQTLSNLLAALLEGDYSIRSRRPDVNDALGLALMEVNALGQILREQRLGALEATALLRKVMEEIDVAIFALDDQDRLRLMNRAGERLLGLAAERALGGRAEELGIEPLLRGDDGPRMVDASFPGAGGRWELRRTPFRQGGVPHRLLVLSDLSRALREEEREAWKRIIRVLGHEINNSLTPIRSIAGSLGDQMARGGEPEDLDDSLRRGLAVIGSRADALSRFMGAYSRLARLPPPRFRPVDVGAWIRNVVAVETRMPVAVAPGPDVTIHADGDQLEQLLINLVRNAVDASLETGGDVSVGWEQRNGQLEVRVVDEGPGLAGTTNLFVPFFTTKPHGTGIGLVLSREIAEAHRGTLVLENRREGRGAEAKLRLPLGQ
jgi:two-component system nitrogen regulation sensor histidine kinase NtrY